MHPQGFSISKTVLSDKELTTLRIEADRLAQESGSACVRHVRTKSTIFHRLSASPEVLSLVPAGLRPVRSILFDKTPTQNWPVAWHQDLTIDVSKEYAIEGYGPWSRKDGSPHVQPPISLLQKMITVRLHLDDTPASNGALRVIPGSHLLGKIPSEKVAHHSRAKTVMCECLAGDALLMSPLILHASSRSEEPKRRRIIHFEFAPRMLLDERLNWQEPE